MFVKAQISIVVMLLAATLFAGAPAVSTPVTNMIFTAFDTETTGFSPENDRLVEIGAVKFRGSGEVLAATNWLVNPEIPILPKAAEVHGITQPMVADAPVFKDVFPQFEAFCADSLLLAHNAGFDIRFLRAELKRSGMKAPGFAVLDTLPLFRTWFPDAESHALEPLSAYLNVQGDIWHRAEADSFHIVNIFNAGMKHRPAITLQQMKRAAGGFEWLNGERN
jgi:DNA polymerase III epsilon subunit family exonuclease